MLQGAPEVSIYTNRSVTFRFSGLQLEFALCLGLFSSSQVDRGSRLLLKSLAGHEIIRRAERILDAGSGVGVLGVSLAALCPDASVVMQDRDALAILFSKYNADANGVGNITVSGELAFESPQSGFDLIVANLPAKAGAPVLRMFCRRALGLLALRGVAAIVVVASLESLVRESLASAFGDIIFEEHGAAHTVFHVVAGASSNRTLDVSRKPIDPAYVRNSATAVVAGTRIELDTVYGLSEFDTPSFATAIAAELFDELPIQRLREVSVLCWNPGQGHIPLFLAQRGAFGRFGVAGRDLLALRISASNLRRFGVSGVAVHHLAGPFALGGDQSVISKRYDAMVAHLDPVSGVPEHEHILTAVRRCVAPGGYFLVYGSSQTLHRLGSVSRNMSLLGTKKRHGFRVDGYEVGAAN